MASRGLRARFVVTAESAGFLYKSTDYWAPEHARCIRWNDAAIGIAWPAGVVPILAAKEQAGTLLADADVFR